MAGAKDSAIAELLALQAEVNALEAEKGKQKQKAEQLLWEKSQPLYERRRQLVTGEKEASKEELGSFEAKVDNESEGQASSTRDAKASKGVPNFWLRVLKHQDSIAEQIRKPDEAALAYLEDVRIKKPKGGAGFRVEFEFASNPYFLDKVLWKEVLLESEDLPISTAVLSEAPPIRWRKDMNLTVRQVVKKAKSGKGKGKAKEGATTLKTKPTQSFFSFFGRGTSKGSKQTQAEDDEDEDGDEEGGAVATSDVPPAHADMILAVWNDVVPNAVELYMSEGLSSQGIESEGDDYELVGGSEAEREGLPPSAQRRLRALQFLHQQRVTLKQSRDAELRQIEADFAARAESLLDRRRFVIVGKERSADRQALAVAAGAKVAGPARAVENMAVPRFWLLALKGCPVTVELIRRADERILAYLADVRAARLPNGLRIDFGFLPNPFIENEVLSRTYTLTDDTQVVVETEATPVKWREGVYNITAKKGSSRGGLTASFFSLFTKDGAQRVFAGDSGTPLTGTELRDRETALAFTLRDVVIPRAVDLYQVAAAWGPEEEPGASEEDEDSDSEGALDRDEIRRRVKGKAARGRRARGGDGDDWTCCGLSRTQVLVLLSLLIALPQVLYLVEMLLLRR